jgi:hypothetical protein
VLDYLEYLLTMLPSVDFRNHPEYLDDYLPCGKCVTDYLSDLKPDENLCFRQAFLSMHWVMGRVRYFK